MKQAGSRTVFGAGLITLDIIIQQDETPSVAHAAGGTCGNVIAALAYLGWETTPVGRLGDDAAGNAIRHEFSSLGISGRELTREGTLASARIVQFIVERRNRIQHRFGFSCPACGTPFSRFRPPTLEQAETVLAKRESPDVFFFDRVSAAILAMAAEFRKRGALIYFEPSGVGRPADFSKALAVAHIVKYSEDRMHGIPAALKALEGQRLEIETRGAQGLRFRWLGDGASKPWRSQPAFKVRSLRDAAGAGDWCTAGFLYQLDWKAGRPFEQLREGDVGSALMLGQALAALNCQHVGARGATNDLDSAVMLSSVSAVQANGMTDVPSRVHSVKAAPRGEGVSCQTCLRD
ncbi:MAG: PfkB family carbohydrate kinase [Vicinamibacterales bacterium]